MSGRRFSLRRLSGRSGSAAEGTRAPSVSEVGHLGRRRRMAVDDCIAFLDGSLVEYRLAHGQSVAPWEWTNLLAHGDEASLRAELEAHHPRVPSARETPTDTWRAARSYLIAELLGLREICGPLADLQRSSLVPLELELAERPEVAVWRPSQWLLAVEGLLNDRRRAASQVLPPESRSSE